jgi:exodeoxyribonuclease V alpha subunit
MGLEIQLTDEQQSAIGMMQNNKVGILTGGPGTGKTTTIKEILAWSQKEGLSTVLCAPTGKAAKRMSETTGKEAATIHRTLGARMGASGFEFTVNEENPMWADLVVIDELSMVTNNLMADLLRGVDKRRTKLLFVGDHGQLPSVGPGAVLRDLLAADCLPHVELTKIHRNSGEIVKACHAINKGQVFDPPEQLDPEQGFNYRHIEADTPEHIREIIKVLVKDRMPARGYDPVWDVQMISPTNSRTVLSCDGLNDVLQEMLNPLPNVLDETQGADKFRLNDKIIQTKNRSVDEDYIVNGDIGEIIEYPQNTGQMTVRFFDPERIVKLPKQANDLLRAYCITCHRMQGSEAPVIIIPVHKVFGYFVNRSWIYTAISRAKEICITVGQFRAVRHAIHREDAVVRKTMLKEKLIEQTIMNAEI